MWTHDYHVNLLYIAELPVSTLRWEDVNLSSRTSVCHTNVNSKNLASFFFFSNRSFRFPTQPSGCSTYLKAPVTLWKDVLKSKSDHSDKKNNNNNRKLIRNLITLEIETFFSLLSLFQQIRINNHLSHTNTKLQDLNQKNTDWEN